MDWQQLGLQRIRQASCKPNETSPSSRIRRLHKLDVAMSSVRANWRHPSASPARAQCLYSSCWPTSRTNTNKCFQMDNECGRTACSNLAACEGQLTTVLANGGRFSGLGTHPAGLGSRPACRGAVGAGAWGGGARATTVGLAGARERHLIAAHPTTIPSNLGAAPNQTVSSANPLCLRLVPLHHPINSICVGIPAAALD